MMLLPRRRIMMIGASGLLLAGLAPARATEDQVAVLIEKLVGAAKLTPGRVKLDLPLLVENGNAVAMTVGVDGGDGVRSLHVFAERNPLPNVANFTFGPRSGHPRVSTRIRLATSQTVIAIAVMTDGSCWSDSVDLLVTLAACIE